MAVPAPTSLRELYTTPSTAWSFVPPSLSQDSSNSSHPPAAGSSSSSPWSTRTAPNPLFDLSSSLPEDDSGLNVVAFGKELLLAALLEYSTSAIAQPWEVGRTLLQVQWIPRDPTDLAHDGSPEVVDDEGEVCSLVLGLSNCLVSLTRMCGYSSATLHRMRMTRILRTQQRRNLHDLCVQLTKLVTLYDSLCSMKGPSRST